MAHEVVIAGSPCRAKVRNPWAVAALTVLTLGLYSIVWWYAINRELRDLGLARAVDGLGDDPGRSALAFSGLSVFTLYVAWVWTVVSTSRRVRRAEAAVGTTDRLNGWISAALWILTFTIGGIIYTQSHLNRVWDFQAPQQEGAAELDTAVEGGMLAPSLPDLHIEDPDEWPSEHPAIWDSITRRAYRKRYGKPPGV